DDVMVSPGFLEFALERVDGVAFLAVARDDVGTGTREGEHYAAADPAGAAGHQRLAAGELEIHDFLPIGLQDQAQRDAVGHEGKYHQHAAVAVPPAPAGARVAFG